MSAPLALNIYGWSEVDFNADQLCQNICMDSEIKIDFEYLMKNEGPFETLAKYLKTAWHFVNDSMNEYDELIGEHVSNNITLKGLQKIRFAKLEKTMKLAKKFGVKLPEPKIYCKLLLD